MRIPWWMAGMACAAAPLAATAQVFPSKPVRIIAGSLQGTGGEISLRLVAPKPGATTQGAACAIGLGLAVWIACGIMITQKILPPEPFLPPQFAGWLASLCGMIAGSLALQRYGAVKPHHQQAAAA